MKKVNLLLSLCFAFVFAGFAQFQLVTVPPLNGGNGTQGVTFGLTSNRLVILDSIYCTFNTTGLTDVWYTTTDVTGPPDITTLNGWTQVGQATVATATGAGGISVIPLNIGVTIQPGTTYRFFVNGNIGASVAYTTGTAGVSAPFTDGIITVETGNLVGYGGPAPNPANHPRQFNGGVKYTVLGGSNDAAVMSLDSLNIFCSGSNDIYATIANFGSNQIDSVTVNWELNGVAQPSFIHYGLLDTLSGSNPYQAVVHLGNVSLPAGASNIKVYTSDPNGAVDTTNFNDTLYATVSTAAEPRSINALSSTLNSATFTVDGVASTATIDYEYGAFGFTLGTGTAGFATASPFTITGLTQGSAYDIYVRTNCGGGDVSTWVGPLTFNTAYGVPFFEDFETFPVGVVTNPGTNGWFVTPYNGFGWDVEDASGFNENSTATGPLWDHTTFGTVGGKYVYMETSGGTTGATADLMTPPIYVDPSYNSVELSFWYFLHGTEIDRMYIVADTNGVEDTIGTYIGMQQLNQTDNWLQASYYLNGYQGKSVTIKFRGVNAPCCGGDLAIDDVNIDPVPNLSAGLERIVEPNGAICPFTTNPVVAVQNTGLTPLTSVDVVSVVNGSATTTNFTLSSLTTGDTVHLTLPAITFSAGTVYDLQFYTANPNAGVDGFNGDDTVAIGNLITGLSGSVTIDPALPASATNYTSFSSLADQLNANGVCGPVTVTVAAGTYNDVFALDNVAGLSATNTLTIDGVDSSLVTLSNALSSDPSLIDLNGVSYTTVKNMTLTSSANTSYKWGVRFSGASSYDSLLNLRILMSTSNTFGVYCIGASGSTTSNATEGDNAFYTTVMNCYLEGGDYSIHFEGSTSGTWNAGNTFINNTLTSFDDYGFYFDQQDSLSVIGNHISGARTTSNFSGYGIASFEPMNFKFKENYIEANYYGIYCTNANSTKNPDAFAEIVNNMVSSANNRGIYLTVPFKINIFHNSVNVLGSEAAFYVTGVGTDSLDTRNNLFVAETGRAMDIGNLTDTLIFLTLDYNVYKTGGTTLIYEENTSYADLAAYQTAQPLLNVNSLETDPQFLSATDLHIIGGAINDLGDNTVFVLTDIDGDTRPMTGSTNVDPGADEHDPPSCFPPTNIVVSNATLDGFKITWDGVGTSFEYLIVPAGASPTTGTYVAVNTDSVIVTGLMSSTSYDIYLREVCGRGIYSLTVGPETYRTANGIPYYEDFEAFPIGIINNPGPGGWTVTPYSSYGWDAEDATGANENSIGTGPFYDHTQFGVAGGIYLFTETSGGTVGDTAELVSPPVYIDPAFNTFEVQYWYFNFGSLIDRMDVYMRSNGADVLLGSYVGQQQAAQTDNWRQGSHIVTGYGGQSVQLVFKGVNVPCCDGDIAVDDIAMIPLLPNDAGVVDLISPQLPICPGTTTPVVGVRNFGTDTLTSVRVIWDVNGVKDSITYNGQILPGDTVPVTLGNVTINASTIYDISFYTNYPNGNPDDDNESDTLHLDGLQTGLASGNYTINSAVVTGGSNFQSFTDFANAVNTFGLCGTVNVDVAVGSGPYNEQFMLSRVEGSGMANQIHINGHGETIAFGSSDNNQRAVVTLESVYYVSIDSLNVDADQGSTYGWGVQLSGDAHHISYTNSTIATSINTSSTFFTPFVMTGSPTSPTTASQVEYVNVSNCEILGGYYCMTLTGNTADKNKFINVSDNIVRDFYAYGIYAIGLDSSLIEGNEITRPNQTLTTTFYGIYQSTNENTIVNRNAIHNSHDLMATNTSTSYPIYMAGDAPSGVRNLISNNLIYNINNNGSIYGIYDLGSDGANYVNNTVSLDNTAATGGTIRGIYQSAVSSSSSFVNNIVTISNGGTGAKHGIYLNSTATNMYVDYNNVFMNSAGTGNQSYGYYGGDQVDLATWQLATPSYGVNSQEVDPDYVDMPNDNYSPGNLAVTLNNTALPVPEVPEDFYGMPRPAAPDFGAIEFTPTSGNNLAMRDFLAPVFDTDSCYGAAEDVVVTIVNFGGAAIDFTLDTTDLTMNVTGGTTQTLALQLNDNSLNGGAPLAIGAQIEVNMGSINMSAAGLYSFEGYLELASDTFPNNDTLLAAVTILAPDGGEIAGLDTICEGDTTTLSVDNYVGELQWQEWDGANWVDLLGQTGTQLEVYPSVISEYRVLACGVAPSDTFTLTPIILNTAPIAMGDTTVVICGQDGSAIASASSANPNARFVWYTSATGIEEVDTSLAEYAVNAGSDSLTYTRFGTVQGSPAVDTVWVAEVVEAGSGENSIKISELDPGATDMLEIQNVSGSAVDVTGWQVAVSNDYTNINLVNTIVQTLSGVMAPNQTMYWTDGAVNPWGNNLFWNESGSPGWAIILDAQGNIVDYMAFEWSAADIMGQNITVGSFTGIQPGVAGAWVGNGAVGNGNPAGSSIYRFGTEDHDDASDWIHNTFSPGTPNALLVTPFAGGRCESPRAMAIVMVDCLVGIEDGEAITSSLEVYPNPSEGLFTLSITTVQKENFNLSVRDVKGQLVFEESVNVNGNYRTDMDFTSLAKGVYYLQIQTDSETRVEKLVVQ